MAIANICHPFNDYESDEYFNLRLILSYLLPQLWFGQGRIVSPLRVHDHAQWNTFLLWYVGLVKQMLSTQSVTSLLYVNVISTTNLLNLTSIGMYVKDLGVFNARSCKNLSCLLEHQEKLFVYFDQPHFYKLLLGTSILSKKYFIQHF